MGPLDRLLGRRLSLSEVVERTSIGTFLNAHAQVHSLVASRAFPAVLGTDSLLLNKAAWDLVVELLAFTVHLADRIAAHVLSPPLRRGFRDRLLESVSSNLSISILKGAPREDHADFRTRFVELCDRRADAYGTLPVPEVGAAPVTGTLFWEAGRQCARRLFDGDMTATLRLPLVFGRCMDAVKDLRGQLLHVADE
jgi:hypothetical protein